MMFNLPLELIAHIVECVGTSHGLRALTRLALVSRDMKVLSHTMMHKNHAFHTECKVEYAGRARSACLTRDGKLCIATPDGVVVYENGNILLHMPVTITASTQHPSPHILVTTFASHIFVSVSLPTQSFNMAWHSPSFRTVSSFHVHGPYLTSFHRKGFDAFNPSTGLPFLHMFSSTESQPKQVSFPVHLVSVARQEDALYTLDAHGHVRMFDFVHKRLHRAFDWRIPDPVSIVAMDSMIVVGGRHTLAAFTLDGTLMHRKHIDSEVMNVSACGHTLVIVKDERVVTMQME